VTNVSQDVERFPPEVALVAAFVNTRDLEGQEDLPAPSALRDWLADRELLPAETQLDESDFARALELREALRDLLRVNAGEPARPEVIVAANDALARLPLRVGFDGDAEPRLRAAGTGLDAALATIVAGVVAAQASGTWVRLKICAKDSCRWAFYDRSKNQSGRWCSMAGCGNKVKTKTYRARKRSDSPA
jgi:predicted RNA-binding Zn ribbon-like protein